MQAPFRNAESRQPVVRALLIFLPIAALIGISIWVLHVLDCRYELALYKLEAAQSLRLQYEIVNREFEAIESDLLYLANQDSLRAFLLGASPERTENLERDYQSFALRKRIYDQVRCLDAQGIERIRVNYAGGTPHAVDPASLQDKSDRYYFKEAAQLGRDEVYRSPLDLNIEHGEIEAPAKPVMRMATPVMDDAGNRIGIMVLNYLGQTLINHLDEAASATLGPAILLNQDGFWLHGTSPEKQWGFALGHNHVFEDTFPDAWATLANASEGQFVTPSGLFTIQRIVYTPRRSDATPRATALPPPPLDRENTLILVSHIPRAMLYERPNAQISDLVGVYLIVLLLLLALVLLLTQLQEKRRRDQQELRQSEARLRALSSQLLSAQEDERRRISRDLHDDLGHRVTAVCLYIERAAQMEGGSKRDALERRALEESKGLLDRIRQFSLLLRPQILDDLGLRDAVQSHLSLFEQRTGINTASELDFTVSKIPHDLNENVYRILQEALNNVAKHAHTAEVEVRITARQEGIELLVADNGGGFDPAGVDECSLGILGMRERAELRGGTFSIQPRQPRGTEVRAWIPIAQPGQDNAPE